jgi:hypothetical protein
LRYAVVCPATRARELKKALSLYIYVTCGDLAGRLAATLNNSLKGRRFLRSGLRE